MTKVWTVTMNPAIDLGAEVGSVVPDAKLRCSEPSIEPGGGGVNVSRALRRVDAGSTAVFPEGPGLGGFYRHLVEAEGVDCRTFGIGRPMHRISNHFRETESRRAVPFQPAGTGVGRVGMAGSPRSGQGFVGRKGHSRHEWQPAAGRAGGFTRLLAEVAADRDISSAFLRYAKDSFF